MVSRDGEAYVVAVAISYSLERTLNQCGSAT